MTHRQSPLSKLAAASAYPSAAAKLLRRLIPMGSRPRVKVSSELSGTGFENDLPDIESFGRYLPYDEVIDNHFVALSAADPAGPEGLGFTIEVTPQTGVTPEMEKTLLTLIQTPLAVGSTIAVTVYASPAVEGLLEVWKHSHEAGLSLLSESAAAVARRSVLGRTALLERASREQILPSAPVEVRHFRDEFGENAVWNLDPFQYMLPDMTNGSKAEDTDDSAEMLEMVVKVVSELMTAKGLDDYSESILTRCVLETASAIARGRLEGLPAGNSMERLRRSLLGYRLPGDDHAVERTALKMAAMLEPYAEGGAFERWFDGSGRSIDFSSARFCVLELDGLSAHKRLRAGVLMTLMLSIDRAMRQSPKSEAKLVLIDEAWDLMGEGASGRFIETGYRRARKLNGAFVTATQSIADFHMSETAQAAWRCADTRIFLRQDADNIKALEHDGRMVHDPWLSEAIASLTTVAGAWSEMVVKVGDDPAAVGRLLLDPYSRVVYSTLPAEVESVSRWQAAGAPLAQAIEYTAQGRLPPEPKVSGELCPS